MPSSSGRKEKGRKIGTNKIVSVLIVLIVLFSSLAVYFYVEGMKSTTTTTSTSSSSPYVSEYGVIDQNSIPNAIAVDSAGNVWFVIWNESDLGVWYASNSSLRMFHIPVPTSQEMQSWGIAIDNSRHLVWFGDDTDDFIWSFNTETNEFNWYNVTNPTLAFPYQIVLDSSGNVWFTESTANKIGEITTTGQLLQFPLPASLASVPYSGPTGFTMDENGTFWFSDTIANSIGSFQMSGNNYTFHVYNMTGKVTEPVGIAVDSQGNVWMTEHGPSLVAEFNPSTGYFRAITTHIPPPPLYYSLPYFVYVDSKGNIWFNEHQGNAIGRFSPSNDSMVEYLIPTKVSSDNDIAGAITMALSQNGTPWFTEWFAGKIGTVNLGVPVNIGFSFENSTVDSGALITLSSTESINLSLRIHSIQSATSSSLSVYLSNPDLSNSTAGFSYSFSPSSGKGNYTSELTIQDQGLAAGTYYFTVSLETSNLIISRVIDISAL